MRAAASAGQPTEFALPDVPAVPVVPKPGADAILLPVRQILAAPGKPVPRLDSENHSDDEDAPDGADIALAWFALPIAPPPIQTPLVALVPRAIVAPSDEEGAFARAPAGAPVSVVDTAMPAKAAMAEAEAGAAMGPLPLPEAGDQAGSKAFHRGPLAPDVIAPQPVEQPLVAQPTQLAATTFAAALETHTAPRRSPAEEAPAPGAPAAPIYAVRPHAVGSATDVQQGALDMRRQEWVGQMVERIEALRDAAPVRETRLSLAPEALGKVDVSIRHEGDRIHIHFAAETQAARQLIADAQPRLSELAEARGVKLGQTSVDGGDAGQGAPRRGHEGAPLPPVARPAEAPAPITDSTNDRIA